MEGVKIKRQMYNAMCCENFIDKIVHWNGSFKLNESEQALLFTAFHKMPMPFK